MSRSAHAKSSYLLRKLPSCSRCNTEFILVAVAYEGTKGFRYEWECTKCHKAVPKENLREEPASREDVWLSQWCKENELARKRQIEYGRIACAKKVSH